MIATPRPPSHSDELKVSFPGEHILLLTMNRPKAHNAMNATLARDLRNVLNWYESAASLWVAILTGEGRAFCAGADLKEWNENQQAGQTSEQEWTTANVYGFGSISRRHTSSKPIIAAVNGGAYGGAVEMVLNCDIVIASEDAKFAFPEVKRGVIAIQGAIPRLANVAGHQLASEMLLLGNTISASEAQNRFRFVNIVVPGPQVLPVAIHTANQIVQNSPDAVQSTKRGLLLAQKHNFEETVVAHIWSPETTRTYKGANIKEGLNAFAQKRAPVWINPVKL